MRKDRQVLGQPQPSDCARAWLIASGQLAAAQRELDGAPAGIARQGPYTRVLIARRRCASVIHSWLISAVQPAPVHDAIQVVLLGDGVLFDEAAEVPSLSLAGAIVVRVLQLAGIAVVVSTGSSVGAVGDLVREFKLAGAIAEYAVPLGPLPAGRAWVNGSRIREQLDVLRSQLRSDPEVVLDPERSCSLRACRIVDGHPQPISGSRARTLLERLRVVDVTFRVTPRHTDFLGNETHHTAALRELLSLPSLAHRPLAAVASSRADSGILREAAIAFMPVGTLPSYRAHRGQQVVCAGYRPDDVLWAAAWHVLPSGGLRQQAAEMLASITCPDWLPRSLARRPALDARPLAHGGSRWPAPSHHQTGSTTTVR